jgi:PKD repeat protein
MARPTKSSLPIVAALLLAASWGCTTKKQEAPPLTGPSELGTSISITVSPDVLRQDGASQSLVTVTARDNSGQPLRNLTLRAEITVGGIITDFGNLSARNIVTDANGRATSVYTAPPAGPIAVDTGTVVSITVSPMGTDFGNATAKTVDIRLVPPGVIGAPPSSLRIAINTPAAVVGDTAVFTATITDAAGNDASSQVASYQWNFGDGTSSGGRTASHVYSQPGNYAVTLTITDVLGRIGQSSQSITVGGGTNPTATFFTTPSSPNVGQQVTFNASQALAAPGHRITSYAWDFGDGTTGSGVQTTHAYLAPGSYTVILITTDDVGRKGTLTQTITVGAAGLTADFTFSPSSPAVGQSVSFDASTSKASTGRTITSYAWNFDDGTTGSGVQTSHPYNRTGTFNVRLTVTDDLGQSQSVTKAVTVGGSTPTAAFTFSPSSPRRGQTVNFDASASRAASGRAIATYAWNFDDGAIAFGVTTQHAFVSNGTFNVRLTITDDIGQTSTVTQPVVVSDANPTASFTFSPSSPATNQSVVFDASASSPSPGRTIVSYLWNFDDGTTGTGRTTTHAFTTARSYLVRLTVTDDFGNTGTTSQSVTVSGVSPVSGSFTFSPSTPTTGQSVVFDASSSRAASGHSIVSYAWTFDDGTGGTGVTTSHVFTTPRTFLVRLTVTDDVGQTNTATANVTVSSSAPTADFTFQPSTPTPGQTVSFDASISKPGTGRAIASYSWNFGDGTTGSGVAPSHAYTAAGTYNVTLTVTDDIGQTSNKVSQVPVGTASAAAASFVFTPSSPQPVGTTFTFDASQSKGSGSAPVSRYQWQFLGNPNTAGQCAAPIAPSTRGAPAGPVVVVTTPTTTHTYTSADTYCVFLTIFDNQGNSATTFRLLTIQ